MMKGQILHQMNDIANARKFYAKGLENCRDSIPLWLLLARLEEDLGKYFNSFRTRNKIQFSGNNVKARSVLERARLKNPCNDVLWIESIQVSRLLFDFI